MSLDMLGQVVQKLVQIPAEMLGMVHDLLEKLAGSNGRMWWRALGRFLRRENPWGTPITLDVPTDGRTGEQWIASLEGQGNRVGGYAKELLRSEKFVSTNGVTYHLVVISGDEFEDGVRTNRDIRAEAASRGYPTPSAEVAPYLREMVSDEEIKRMGFWALIVMHEPITDSDGYLDLLGVGRDDDGRWLSTSYGRPDYRWFRECGFVFLVPASTVKS